MADATAEVEGEGAQAPAPQPVAGSVNSQNQHAKLGKVITRMLQADAEVGAVANATASCISGAVELFVEKLVKEAQATVTGGRTKIDAGHIRAAIHNNVAYDFLKDIVADVEDIKEADAEDAPPRPKRRRQQRSKDGASTSPAAGPEKPAAAGSRKGGRRARKPSSKSIEAAEGATMLGDEDAVAVGGDEGDDGDDAYDPEADREAAPVARPDGGQAPAPEAERAGDAPPAAPAEAPVVALGVGMGHEDEDEDYDD